MPIHVNVTSLSTLITDVREAAETVRTYGTLGKDTIATDVPASLYVVAALMESHLRGIVLADHAVARIFNDAPPTRPEPLTFDQLQPVPSYVTPSPVSRDVQVAELNGAVDRLRTVSRQLPAVLETRSTPTYVERLEVAASTVAVFAAAVG